MQRKDGQPRKRPEPRPVTLTAKRVEIGYLNTDLLALDALVNKFHEDEWQQIVSKYPNAHRNVLVIRDATERALEKMEK